MIDLDSDSEDAPSPRHAWSPAKRQRGQSYGDCPLCHRAVPRYRLAEHVDSCLGRQPRPASDGEGQARKEEGFRSARDKQPEEAARDKEEGFRSARDKQPEETAHDKEEGFRSARDEQRKRQRTASTDSGQQLFVPLAEQLRPTSIDELIGQDDALAVLKPLIASGRQLPSMILWGPPGTGKTSIALAIARRTSNAFVTAAPGNVAELRSRIEAARNLRAFGRQTTLFLDEIHRFTKLHQDALLPSVEDGTVHLIAATTENPSFYVNNALLSRCRVVPLHKLTDDDILLLRQLATSADGDARRALNLLELCCSLRQSCQSEAELLAALDRSQVMFDRDGDEHYSIISALHKSMRGNDPNAAVYWLARQLAGGEDPRFICRRLIVFASEDVGLANPLALRVAVDTLHAVCHVGMPECEINLAHCVIFLASCAKSTSAYRALKAAKQCVKTMPNLPPPKHIINAPTRMMKQLGYADGYVYNPDCGDDAAGKILQTYLPAPIESHVFFTPNAVDQLDIRHDHSNDQCKSSIQMNSNEFK